MFHVGDEVGDAVVQGCLPARRPFALPVRLRLGLLQFGEHERNTLRVLEGIEFRLKREPEVLGSGQQVLGHRAPLEPLRLSDDLLPQVADQSGEPGFLIELGVIESGGVQSQIGGDRHEGHLGILRAQMRQVCTVQFGHPAPLWIEIGLGQDTADVRNDPHGLAQEPELGLRVFLGSVGHQDHSVRGGQGGQGGE